MMGVNTRNMQSCLQKCNKLNKSHRVGHLLKTIFIGLFSTEQIFSRFNQHNTILSVSKTDIVSAFVLSHHEAYVRTVCSTAVMHFRSFQKGWVPRLFSLHIITVKQLKCLLKVLLGFLYFYFMIDLKLNYIFHVSKVYRSTLLYSFIDFLFRRAYKLYVHVYFGRDFTQRKYNKFLRTIRNRDRKLNNTVKNFTVF